MATQIQQRRGTAAEWASINPILAEGEIGIEIDTGVLKVGDGRSSWNSLVAPYLKTVGGTLAPISPSSIPLTVQGLANQTGDLVRYTDVTGTILSRVSANGEFYLGASKYLTEATGIPRGLLDAKGDLIVATGDNNVARFPLGTMDLVLTADPSLPTGLKWSTVSRAADVQVFTASGTWTKPANARWVMAIAFGGGGGGGAYVPVNYDSQGGGNGGTRNQGFMLAAGLPSTISVTVGQGGASNVGTTVGTGGGQNPGGNSSFGIFVVAKGGNQTAFTGDPPISQGGYGTQITPTPPLMYPGAGGGYSFNYGQQGINPGSSPLGTAGVARSGSGIGGDGGYGRDGIAQDGFAPGGGGGAASSPNGNIRSGAGARGEVIVITQF